GGLRIAPSDSEDESVDEEAGALSGARDSGVTGSALPPLRFSSVHPESPKAARAPATSHAWATIPFAPSLVGRLWWCMVGSVKGGGRLLRDRPFRRSCERCGTGAAWPARDIPDLGGPLRTRGRRPSFR